MACRSSRWRHAGAGSPTARDRFSASFACLVLIAPLISLYGMFTIPIAIVSIAFVEAVIQAVAVPASQAAMASACPPTARGGAGPRRGGGTGGRRDRRPLGRAHLRGSGPTFLFAAAALVTLGLGGLAWVLYRRAGPSPSRRTGGSIA